MFQPSWSTFSSPFSCFCVFTSSRPEVLFSRMVAELTTDNYASDKCFGLVDSDPIGLDGNTAAPHLHGTYFVTSVGCSGVCGLRLFLR